jgi:hypothetical protein
VLKSYYSEYECVSVPFQHFLTTKWQKQNSQLGIEPMSTSSSQGFAFIQSSAWHSTFLVSLKRATALPFSRLPQTESPRDVLQFWCGTKQFTVGAIMRSQDTPLLCLCTSGYMSKGSRCTARPYIKFILRRRYETWGFSSSVRQWTSCGQCMIDGWRGV